MSAEFEEAAKALVATNEQFAAGEISPLQHRNLRESSLSAALRAMAAEMGVQLKEPVQLGSRGEFSIRAVLPGGQFEKDGAGQFGEAFSAVLNRHNPRCGVAPGAVLAPENSWCWLNHFDAERMVLEHYAAAQPQRRTKPRSSHSMGM